MNIEITDLVQRYRLALRYLWNNCYWVDPELRSWDAVYLFRELKLPLFRGLVAGPLGLEYSDRIFGPCFQVVPDMKDGVALPSMQVNRRLPSSPDGGIWEVVNGPFQPDDLRLTLVDLFDWSPLGYIDLRYYVVLIEAFRTHPDKIGQHALVDVTFVNILVDQNDYHE